MTPRTPETHAYRILPHVDVTGKQTRESLVAADVLPIRNDIPIAAEDESVSAIGRKYDETSLSSSYNSFHRDDFTKISSTAEDEVCRNGQWKVKNYDRQCALIANNDETEKVTSVRFLSNIDHVCEEVRAMMKEPRDGLHEYDIHDYYEKYSPATAKTLIDTLFLPRHEICRECAIMRRSPVYTDRLIYAKESLLAVEVILRQRDDVSCFEYRDEDLDDIFRSRYDRDRMLIYNYEKANAAGIFYSHCWPRDVFDPKSLLKPSIHVISRACYNLIVNTQLYHRHINSYHVRISRTGCAPMTFYRDRGTMISCTKRINDDSQDSLIHQTHQLRDDGINSHGRNRSSLLLEPLLLMSEMTTSGRRKNAKNRISRSERAKIIRIIMAYVLSFLILTSITFYVVYFT